MLVKQRHVAPIGAPHDVEDVAGKWRRTDDAVDRDIRNHANEQMRRCAKLPGLVHDIERDQRHDEVANTRNKPDNRIQAKSDIGARHDKSGIKQRRKRVNAREALLPGCLMGLTIVKLPCLRM